MKAKSKFIYDNESDSLFIYKENRQIHSSLKLGEIIISVDKDFRLCAVEILNPDILFKIPKKNLIKLYSAHLRVLQRGSLIWISILLKFEGIKIDDKDISIPIETKKPIII